MRKVGERAGERALRCGRSPFHGSHRRIRSEAAGAQALADLGNSRDAHQKHKRAAQPRQGGIILVGNAAFFGVGGDDVQRVGETAVGYGDPSALRSGDGRSDAGDDFPGDAVSPERFDLLAAAAEQERVAAFESHDALAFERLAHEDVLDAALRHGVVPPRFADVDAAG